MNFLTKTKSDELDEFENNLLKEMIDERETKCLHKIKYWNIEYNNPLVKDFAQSQIYYYELELRKLLSLQLKLTKKGIVFKKNG